MIKARNRNPRVLWDNINPPTPTEIQKILFLSICQRINGNMDKDNNSPTDPLLYASNKWYGEYVYKMLPIKALISSDTFFNHRYANIPDAIKLNAIIILIVS